MTNKKKKAGKDKGVSEMADKMRYEEAERVRRTFGGRMPAALDTKPSRNKRQVGKGVGADG
jgi:hypothetical protein